MNQRTTGPNAAIDLNRPGIGQNNVILGTLFQFVRSPPSSLSHF